MYKQTYNILPLMTKIFTILQSAFIAVQNKMTIIVKKEKDKETNKCD